MESTENKTAKTNSLIASYQSKLNVATGDVERQGLEILIYALSQDGEYFAQGATEQRQKLSDLKSVKNDLTVQIFAKCSGAFEPTSPPTSDILEPHLASINEAKNYFNEIVNHADPVVDQVTAFVAYLQAQQLFASNADKPGIQAIIDSVTSDIAAYKDSFKADEANVNSLQTIAIDTLSKLDNKPTVE